MFIISKSFEIMYAQPIESIISLTNILPPPTGKRTLHNAFDGRDKPRDPYGVARFDLSDLLLGQQILHLKAPIHNCPLPDVLGLREGGKQDGKLVGVAGAVDGPGK